MNPQRFHPLTAVLLIALAGCTASTGTTPAATSVVVSLAPMAAQVQPGGSVPFTASVTGTADGGVAWSVQEGAAGGSVDASGVYTAPPTAGTFHVVAASRVDPSRLQIASVTVGASSVQISPASSTVDACKTVTFSASVPGAASPGVSWSVKEGQAGGTVTQGGVYTAPPAAGTYHVVASSLADPAQAAEASVVVGPDRVLSVAVTPGSTSASPGGAVAFSATVTTSCGSFAAN